MATWWVFLRLFKNGLSLAIADPRKERWPNQIHRFMSHHRVTSDLDALKVAQRRTLCTADVGGLRAARVEGAACRWVEGDAKERVLVWSINTGTENLK
jgi:hypothetical protein